MVLSSALPPSIEWPFTSWIVSHCYMWRIRSMGLWCSDRLQRVLSSAMARLMGSNKYSVKEMVPVVIALAEWGRSWTESTVAVRSDSMVVVHALTAGSAKDPILMHLLRCLHFYTATYQISVSASHVPGALNTAAVHYHGTTCYSSLNVFQRQPSHPLRSQHSYCRCSFTNAPIGSLPAGGECSFLHVSAPSTSTVNTMDLQIRPEEVSSVLPGLHASLLSTNRRIALYVCGSSWQTKPHSSNNECTKLQNPPRWVYAIVDGPISRFTHRSQAHCFMNMWADIVLNIITRWLTDSWKCMIIEMTGVISAGAN